jgi:zinc-ribbon domain
MFCPNCGATNSTEQKFCRACGLNLEPTALSLLEQIPSAESAKLLRREKNLEKFGSVALGGFGLVILSGVGTLIYLIITKIILNGGSLFGGIMLIAFLIFSALSLAYVVLSEDLKERKQKANPTLENELTKKRETGKLLEEKPFEPARAAASVTENTTELLYAKQKTKKFE